MWWLRLCYLVYTGAMVRDEVLEAVFIVHVTPEAVFCGEAYVFMVF